MPSLRLTVLLFIVGSTRPDTEVMVLWELVTLEHAGPGVVVAEHSRLTLLLNTLRNMKDLSDPISDSDY
jgi:hypothetical protein